MKIRGIAISASVAVLLTSSFLAIDSLGQSAQAEVQKSACQQGFKGNNGACKDKTMTFPRHGTSSPNCRAGFLATASNTLCMTSDQPANSYANAEASCRALGGRVADYGDWRARGIAGGASPTLGAWLGPITADNRALFVNLNNPSDFDGETNRFDSRVFACAHDRL